MNPITRSLLPALGLIASLTVAEAHTPQHNSPAMRGGGMSDMAGRDSQMAPGMMMMMPGMMGSMRDGMTDDMPMMQMMHSRTMRGGMGMPYEHVEGRIAFLKAEIGITPEQEAAWTDFAAALRVSAGSMRAMHERMMERAQGDTVAWSERLEVMAGMMTARAEALRTVADAAGPLFATLSEEQRSKAESLLTGPMGMM